MLKAENLVKRFGSVTAVDGLSLSVQAGEVVGLLGPNGAGKTTTLRMLAGILGPDQGRIEVAGLDLAAAPNQAKQRIGFLSGTTQLNRRLSLRDVLRHYGRFYGLSPARLSQRIEELVEELGLAPFASRACGGLSSGEKQRANLARAFLHEPDILILDEPSSSLDILSCQFLREAIRNQRAAGRAILFSTHVMGEAEHLCDRVALIHCGVIVDRGSVGELLARHGCDNLADALLHGLERPRLEQGGTR